MQRMLHFTLNTKDIKGYNLHENKENYENKGNKVPKLHCSHIFWQISIKLPMEWWPGRMMPEFSGTSTVLEQQFVIIG